MSESLEDTYDTQPDLNPEIHNTRLGSVDDFVKLNQEHGIEGDTQAARLESLESLDMEGIAAWVTDINSSVLGLDEPQLSEKTMKIGGTPCISLEDRYDVFSQFIDELKSSHDAGPERTGDALAMAIVMLHPFKDGNGRTARLVSWVFKDDINKQRTEEAADNFKRLSDNREFLRGEGEGGGTIISFVPEASRISLDEQSDPAKVSAYLKALLTEESGAYYHAPFGQATHAASNKEAPVTDSRSLSAEQVKDILSPKIDEQPTAEGAPTVPEYLQTSEESLVFTEAVYNNSRLDEGVKDIIGEFVAVQYGEGNKVNNSAELAKEIRGNDELRQKLGEYFLEKIKSNLSEMPDRIQNNTTKDPGHGGYDRVYEHGEIKSQHYAALQALSYLSGTFNPDKVTDNTRIRPNGEIISGQHRGAAEILLFS